MEKSEDKEDREVAVVENGRIKIFKTQRKQICELLLSGELLTDGEIAKKVKLSPVVVTELLATDPEFLRLCRQRDIEISQKIERASVELALSGKNQVAMQKAQELHLKKIMSDRYGDLANAGARTARKRVNIVLELPETKTDANGMPILQTMQKAAIADRSIIDV